MITKNRNREIPTFANINLLGKCNANCYFCLGKDIQKELDEVGDLNKNHWSGWKNFYKFLDECEQANIKNLYITGQNTDAFLYNDLPTLITYLQDIRKFSVGIRTNGFIAAKYITLLNTCKRSIGYSIHSLIEENQYKVMGTHYIPHWDYILKNTNKSRVSIVVTRHTVNEFFDIIKFVSQYPNVRYIQARRISTDTRYDLLKEDIDVYEELYEKVKSKYILTGTFYGAEVFDIDGSLVTFWRTVETSVNSWNYFVDGTISKEYFVVEGYLKNRSKV